MKCAQITCEKCKELGNEICPYETANSSYGNVYEVIYENEKLVLLLVRVSRKYYLIDTLDRISNSIGPFKNIKDVEEFLKEDTILIDKNKIKILPVNFFNKEFLKSKNDAYKRAFIKEESKLLSFD